MPKLKVTIVQSILHWENASANLEMFEHKMKDLDLRHHLVVLPEMFTTGFSMQPEPLAETINGKTAQWLQQMANKHEATFCGSVMIKEDNKFYNRLLWASPNAPIQYYNKRHLFAFAGEHEKYTAGTSKLITKLNEFTINCNVCYDLRFPVWVRQEEKKYDILLYVANWPSKRSYAWKSLLIARAIENQAYVVAVNRVGTDGNGHQYSGDSCILNPLGEIVFTKENEEFIYTYEIDMEEITAVRKQFPFLQDADSFEIKK